MIKRKCNSNFNRNSRKEKSSNVYMNIDAEQKHENYEAQQESKQKFR